MSPSGKRRVELGDRGEVHRRVVAHRRVRAGAGLHADDALGREHAGERRPDVLGVLLREDVVGDHQRAGAPRPEQRGTSASISAVLPEPTGPPMPMRGTPGARLGDRARRTGHRGRGRGMGWRADGSCGSLLSWRTAGSSARSWRMRHDVGQRGRSWRCRRRRGRRQASRPRAITGAAAVQHGLAIAVVGQPPAAGRRRPSRRRTRTGRRPPRRARDAERGGEKARPTTAWLPGAAPPRRARRRQPAPARRTRRRSDEQRAAGPRSTPRAPRARA